MDLELKLGKISPIKARLVVHGTTHLKVSGSNPGEVDLSLWTILSSLKILFSVLHFVPDLLVSCGIVPYGKDRS